MTLEKHSIVVTLNFYEIIFILCMFNFFFNVSIAQYLTMLDIMSYKLGL